MQAIFDRQRASDLMAQRGIDMLLASTRRNVYYTTGGLWQHIGLKYEWMVGFPRNPTLFKEFVGIPTDPGKAPFVVAPRGDQTDLWLADIWIKDQILYAAQGYEGEPMEPDPVKAVAECIRARNLDRAIIGVELEQLETDVFLRLQKELPQATFKDITLDLLQLRSIKTPEEIRRLRKSLAITEDVMAETFQGLVEGVTELEVHRKIMVAHLEAGSEYPYAHVVFGGIDEKSPWIASPTDKRLKNGDMVWLDMGGDWKHYSSDLSRYRVFGTPTKAHKKRLAHLHGFLQNVYESVQKDIRPGATGSELYKMTEAMFREARMTIGIPIIGHGVGLHYHEYPILGPQDNMPIEAGMVIVMEIICFDREIGILNSEDTVLVTEDGCEMITSITKDPFIDS